jgi:amino acid transporter
MNTNFIKPKTLGSFALVMINIIAIASLRNLPFGAVYGLPLIFFYAVAALIFFIPTALIAAELATAWPNKGGSYIWVREAFGDFFGFFVIWLQWVYNIVWYPTILSFIAGTIAYLIDPALAENKTYMLIVINVLFWGSTIVNCFGMRISSFISTIGTLFGTLLPMAFIIFLGGIWLYTGHHSQISFSLHNLVPNLSNLQNIGFFIAILFGLVGIEMSAMHADEVKNPAKNFPKAILHSVWIIIVFLTLASLAVAVVVPTGKINLITGAVQAFEEFFNAYHLPWLAPIIIGLIILSGLCGVAAWIIGPTKGLLVAANDGIIPKKFTKVNKHDAPISILFMQAIVFTLLCSAFLLMPTVKSSYWILVALSAQFTMIVYIFIFIAALRLRYKHPHVARAYKIPGKNWGIWLVALVGIAACLFAIAIGFVPPQDLKIGSIFKYEIALISSIAIASAIPFVIYFTQKARKKK